MSARDLRCRSPRDCERWNASRWLKNGRGASAVIAILVVLAFMGMLVMLFMHAIPDANKSAFDIALGLIGTLVAAIVNYWFGSSSGSAAKDKTISTALATAAPIVQSTVTTTTVQP